MNECVKLVSTYLSDLRPIIPTQGLCPLARRLASQPQAQVPVPTLVPTQLHFHDGSTHPAPNTHSPCLGPFLWSLRFSFCYRDLSRDLTVKRVLTVDRDQDVCV